MPPLILVILACLVLLGALWHDAKWPESSLRGACPVKQNRAMPKTSKPVSEPV